MKAILAKLVAGETLDAETTAEAFELIMTGEATAAQTAALLAMIEQRGATVDELVGAASVMRGKVAAVAVPEGLTVVDTCGTGGDHTPTFNVSTAAAVVAAAVGRPRNVAIAKHGNRTVTRTSGSSQGLEALGVKLQVSRDTLTTCLDEIGICFCFAPAHHPAMKHAMPVRMDLGIRTIFNLLGPLTNPAGATRQLMGVAKPALTEKLAEVLKRLDCENAMVIHGYKDVSQSAGFCELSTSGPSQISRLRSGEVVTETIDAADLGLARSPLETLLVADPQESASVITRVFAGEKFPPRDIVILNAAAALVVASLADDLAEGIAQATEAIDTGSARATLEILAKLTQADTSG